MPINPSAIDPEAVRQAIFDALRAGAVLAGTETAKLVVRDAYARLKSFIKKEQPALDLAPLESPDAPPAAQAAVRQALLDSDLADNPEVRVLIRNLVVAIQQYQPEAAETVGVDLSNLLRVTATFGDVSAAPGTTGVRIDGATDSELNFGDVGTSSKK